MTYRHNLISFHHYKFTCSLIDSHFNRIIETKSLIGLRSAFRLQGEEKVYKNIFCFFAITLENCLGDFITVAKKYGFSADLILQIHSEFCELVYTIDRMCNWYFFIDLLSPGLGQAIEDNSFERSEHELAKNRILAFKSWEIRSGRWNKWHLILDKLCRIFTVISESDQQQTINSPTPKFELIESTQKTKIVTLPDQISEVKTPTGSDTIFWHGGDSYSIDGKSPIVVSPAAKAVLQAFMKKTTAMQGRELEASAGYTNASKIITELEKFKNGIFKGAIRRPQKKGNKEGYFISVKQFKN